MIVFATRARPATEVAARPRSASLAAYVTLALALVLAGGCAQRRPEGDMIVVAMANAATNLDPRVGTDEASQKAHQLLYGSLMKIDDQLRIVPDLAESLEQPTG